MSNSILIVDDEDSIRSLLTKILTRSGYECVSAANASEARTRLKERGFDVVLSDVNMPGESGLSLSRFILGEYPDTTVLMVSVLDDPGVVEEALDAGIHGYIVKPFHPKGVLISVINALHRRQLEIDNRSYRDNLERLVSARTSALEETNKELELTLNSLRQTQAQFVHSEKMASIGQLAAGVAHEINNPIGFISSNLNTLAEYQSEMAEVVEEYRDLAPRIRKAAKNGEDLAMCLEKLTYIEELEGEADIEYLLEDSRNLIKESIDGVERVKKIVVDLKDFAHPGQDQLQSADINKSLESTLNVVWNELKYKSKVSKEYGQLPLVLCYPHQLNQVFMNLLVNAAQAIAKQGNIDIVTRALEDEVEVSISDTGCGIPEENLNRIFDPFFTTKEVGKGTGLGLHLAYNIIKKHNGSIQVKSKVGEGTTFILRIPVDQKGESRENGLAA